MPTTTTRAQKYQTRWQEIVEDPLLGELPYKVETNHRGQIVLSPHSAHHSRQQKRIQKKLDGLLPEGEAFSEYPIATVGGTKQADVIWASDDRLAEMNETGDPPTRAPEICIEVMSGSNDWDEMEEKRTLYREAGAEEVWVVTEDGDVRFFAEEEIGSSALAPGFPQQV